MAIHTTHIAHTTAIGRRAEQVAADFLKHRGFVIIDRNWRRRDCEIDLIAQKDRVLYFVEVKYRQSNRAGGGMEYVTPRKLQQMTYAANRWVGEHAWRQEYALSVIEVSGEAFAVTGFVESVEV